MCTEPITLDFKGPFSLVPLGGCPWFCEQECVHGRGIYLHTLRDRHRDCAYYIGVVTSEDIKRDLKARQREHVTGYLGGQYYFYDPQKTLSDGMLAPLYDPCKQFRAFLAADGELRTCAYRWVQSLRLFVWRGTGAGLDKEKLKLYESAMIHHLGQQKDGAGRFLDNRKVTLRPQGDAVICVEPRFPEGVCVEGLMKPLKHGLPYQPLGKPRVAGEPSCERPSPSGMA